MASRDIEAMVEELHNRTTRIEQILPTLATRQDLADGLNGVGLRLDRVESRLDRVESRLDALSRQMLVLHEDVKSEIRLLAEHLARVLERLDRRT